MSDEPVSDGTTHFMLFLIFLALLFGQNCTPSRQYDDGFKAGMIEGQIKQMREEGKRIDSLLEKMRRRDNP